MMSNEKQKKGPLFNIILWCALLILYFIFVFLVDGILGIGFKDHWKRIKKWFVSHTDLKSRFLFKDV